VLKWGVKQVLAQLAPGESAARIDKLAGEVLRHPTLCASTLPWIHATAIRAEALAVIAARVAGNDPEKAGAELREKLAGASQAIEKARVAVARAAEAALADLRRWFDLVMDRTTERFVAHTRLVTFGIAFVVCLWFHIDSLRILRQISTDDDLRAALAAGAADALKDAEEIERDLSSPPKTVNDAFVAVRPWARLLDTPPQDLTLESQAAAWIGDVVARSSLPEADKARAAAEMQKSFRAEFEKLLGERYEHLKQTAEGLVTRLDATQLEIFERDVGLLPDYWRADEATKARRFEGKHLLGVLVSVLLLSLGAPFWFNLLRNLSNLRPIVARKVEQSQKGEGA
jgi:hypothetical protein